MNTILKQVLTLFLIFPVSGVFAKDNKYTKPELIAANNLIERVIKGYSNQFILELIEPQNSNDVFEIDQEKDHIVLRGNNTVAIASALNWYLKYTCYAHKSWCGEQLALPKKLLIPKEKTRKVIDAEYRVLFNYCTLSYTASWWNWERWQQEIDFMAMNGVNMPLSVIGLEGVWYYSLINFGFTDKEARQFLVGPAFFAWQWMTNIQSYGGPLPKNWIDSHIKLGQQIINRQIELGMKPIQQGFSGYLPREFLQKFSKAKIQKGKEWCEMEGTAQIDPLDPLFKKFAAVFMQEQKKLFGMHGFYAADPFHEGTPPVNTKEYLNAVGKSIYELMVDVDPNAIWVMQGWSIREDIVTAVPKTKLLILDIDGSKWKQTQKFWGYDFVVGNLHNFGGRINLHGDLNLVASNQYKRSKEVASNAVGNGLFMEAIIQNPVYYDLAFEMTFHHDSIDVANWLKDYATRRYGVFSLNANKAWELLLSSCYKRGTNDVENSSIFASRPSLTHKKSGPNAGFDIPYNPQYLIKALELLITESAKMKTSDGYRFDVVDLTRQVLTNLGQEMDKKITGAFFKKDLTAFNFHSSRFIQLLKDADKLVNTRKEYCFGKWVADARKWGKNQEEIDLYEYNASLLVTQWGGDIFDYSWREWGGLIKEYYLPRWEKYFNMLRVHLVSGTDYTDEQLPKAHGRIALKANDFYIELDKWEKEWIKSKKRLHPNPIGNEVETALIMYEKYLPLLKEYY